MAKHVVIIASGETERRALPHLAGHLRDRAITVVEVRIPPRNGALNPQMAERLIKAVWYENPSSPPDKFVVLMDVDRAGPEEALGAMRSELPQRVAEIGADVLCAYAQEHLEAWYFADAENLRQYLAGNLEWSTHRNPTKSGIRSCISSTCSENTSIPLGFLKRSPKRSIRARLPSGVPASRSSSTRS